MGGLLYPIENLQSFKNWKKNNQISIDVVHVSL